MLVKQNKIKQTKHIVNLHTYLYPLRISLINEDKMKIFSDKQKFQDFFGRGSALKTSMEITQAEENDTR